MIIVRIKNFHDISCKILLLHRFVVIAFVKRIQMETFHRLRIPDTKCIDNAVAVTNDRNIIRNRPDRLISFLSEIASAVLIHINIHIAAEFYFFRIFRSAQLERIAVL